MSLSKFYLSTWDLPLLFPSIVTNVVSTHPYLGEGTQRSKARKGWPVSQFLSYIPAYTWYWPQTNNLGTSESIMYLMHQQTFCVFAV